MFKKADVLALLSISNRKVKNFKHGVLLIFLLKSFIFCLSKPCIFTAVCNVDNKKSLFRSGSTVEDDRDILIHGMPARNRAVHGDLVVVEVLPRSEWRGRSSVIKESQEGQGRFLLISSDLNLDLHGCKIDNIPYITVQLKFLFYQFLINRKYRIHFVIMLIKSKDIVTLTSGTVCI